MDRAAVGCQAVDGFGRLLCSAVTACLSFSRRLSARPAHKSHALVVIVGCVIFSHEQYEKSTREKTIKRSCRHGASNPP